jgi:hypothetical protein
VNRPTRNEKAGLVLVGIITIGLILNDIVNGSLRWIMIFVLFASLLVVVWSMDD